MNKDNPKSAYQKILNKEPINILVVGDSIGEGYGSSDDEHSWPALLDSYIESMYESEVTITNISLGGESSLAGYIRLLQQNQDIKQDLIIVCFGHNDANDNFEVYYESIIRRDLNQYPDCSIICIQEYSQKEYTEKMNGILKVANYYRIPVVDTIQPFQDYSEGYDALTIDGTHSNDSGQEIFADAIEEILDYEINMQSLPIVLKEQPKDKNVSFFDNATWIGVDNFNRDGLVFTTDISEEIEGNHKSNIFGDGSGVAMVVDLSDYPNDNYLKVKNNDNIIAEKEMNWSFFSAQRHIPIVADNIIIKSGWLSIEFANENQADSFNGCGFILGDQV